MKFLRKIKVWLIGTGFEVGERVFWDSPNHPQSTGEYVVISKRDKRGYVGIYNNEMLHKKVRWYELEPLFD